MSLLCVTHDNGYWLAWHWCPVPLASKITRDIYFNHWN